MRALAKSLGVYPTAIYWYVPNRNALLAEVVSLALQDIAPADRVGAGAEAGDWRAWLKLLFRRYRRAVQAHPNIAALMGAQVVSNAGVPLILIERILSVLTKAGFRNDGLIHAFNTVIATMAGFVTLEMGPMPTEDAEDWAKTFHDTLHAANPQLYPHLARNLPRLENHVFMLRWLNGTKAPFDDSFEIFIDAAIHGLAQYLAKPARVKRAS